MLKFTILKTLFFCFSILSCWADRKNIVVIRTSTYEINDTISLSKNITQDLFSMNYLMGKFDPTTAKDFIKIPITYADEQGRYLRKDAFLAFEKMAKAAAKYGHKLIIKSATRNFESQKTIWENKWIGTTILEDNTKASSIKDPIARAKKILLYSSMPSTSRHHWGTDIDINAFVNSYFEKGKGKKLYEWMIANASAYGYCQVYNEKNSKRPNGYNEEKWHWSYMPIASQLSEIAREKLKNEMIKGFLGSETAIQIDMVNNYVMATNIKCN